MKYKKFNEIQVGTLLYCVEISNLDCQFKTVKIREILDELPYSNDKTIEMYIDVSPLVFSFERNKTNWHSMIFTTKEEAIKSAKKQINNKIKEHLELVNAFLQTLDNIENVEFKNEESN